MNERDLVKYFNEYSDSQLKVDSEKELQKAIAETAEDKLGMKKAEFNAMAKLYYLKKYDTDKFHKAEEKAEYIERILELCK